MSKITIAILFVVIVGIITAMYLEVPYITGGPGAFIVIALVYSFVVAKREAGLMSLALEEWREAERDGNLSDEPVVPEYLR